jgi:ubiquinone/menaquinone biosynthesis C-methylase UbiE
MAIPAPFLSMLRCPATRQVLTEDQGWLVGPQGAQRYAVDELGIPLFAETLCSDDALRQQQHYDRIAEAYLANLGYPHTQEYMAYLDRAFLDVVDEASLGQVAELCCGNGEAFHLLGQRVCLGIGVDISKAMLTSARKNLPDPRYFFLQGDATNLPLEDAQFDSVFILGGIHHVNNRAGLFQSIHRILKPGGKFYWREPVDDFWLWRALRAIVYRVSNTLDDETEHPLRYAATARDLAQSGLQLQCWRTFGFLGYCLLMNSDVLVLNRLFRFVPGIRRLTRMMVAMDDWSVRLPGMSRYGLIVVGMAQKPADAAC